MSMLAERIAEARTRRDGAEEGSDDRRVADEELRRLEEVLTQYLTIGRLPPAFEEPTSA